MYCLACAMENARRGPVATEGGKPVIPDPPELVDGVCLECGGTEGVEHLED